MRLLKMMPILIKAAIGSVSVEMKNALEKNAQSVAEQISHTQSVLSSALETHGTALGVELRQALADAVSSISNSSLPSDKGNGKY